MEVIYGSSCSEGFPDSVCFGGLILVDYRLRLDFCGQVDLVARPSLHCRCCPVFVLESSVAYVGVSSRWLAFMDGLCVVLFVLKSIIVG